MARESSTAKHIGGLLAALAAAGLLLVRAPEAPAESSQPSQIVAIVNFGNPTTELSVGQLRLLYALYKRSWAGGIRVHLLLPLADSAAMRFLASRVLLKSDAGEVSRYYVLAAFAHRLVEEPPELSPAQALHWVRSDIGAIALVERSRIGDAAGVRVLSISDR